MADGMTITNPILADPCTGNFIAYRPLYYTLNEESSAKNIGDTDDRHSKNGIATLKKLPRNFQHPST